MNKNSLHELFVNLRNIDVRSYLKIIFEEVLVKSTPLHSINEILVVGGGSNEPELEIFRNRNTSITYCGLENNIEEKNFFYLDLNFVNSTPRKKYDLVICNQVFEHLHNTTNASANLASLIKTNGFLWITFPANNFRHGSPSFYSAGYSKEFLEKCFEDTEFEVIQVGELSSKRVYLIRHLLRIWPTRFQINHPFIAYFGVQGKLFDKILFNLRIIPERILILFSKNVWKIDDNYPLETFGFFKKIH